MGAHRDSARAAAALALLAGLAWGCATTRPPAHGPEPAGAVEEGLASWYGEPYNGRPTSSGEEYRMEGLSAAHRTLPFGTRLRVTNTTNHKTVDVVVNDRGPFVAGRILDLSLGAARALDMVAAGVAPVRAEVLAAGDGMPGAACWEVQVGAFKSEDNFKRAQSGLTRHGYATRLAPAGGGLTRVRVTGLSSRARAQEVVAALADLYPGATPVPCPSQ
jgi:rare lipoprotein A